MHLDMERDVFLFSCSGLVGSLIMFNPPSCVSATMLIAWPSCLNCSDPMVPGAEAEKFACQCGTTIGEGTLTVRWVVGKKHLASKRTRLTLRIREPDLLFTLAPQIAASGAEGRGAASFKSSRKALVRVKRLEANAELPSLHLALASFEGESDEIHHSFDSNPHCLLPRSVDLQSVRESDAELQLTFVICWAVCL